jgi:hypothetical protein
MVAVLAVNVIWGFPSIRMQSRENGKRSNFVHGAIGAQLAGTAEERIVVLAITFAYASTLAYFPDHLHRRRSRGWQRVL